jgi:Rrf2 family protein
MKLSMKCQYALRAVFDLAARNTRQPVKIHDIAKSQGISPRFLEVIMNELRHGQFVESRRGAEGGYMLAKPAKDITVGQIISYVHGPIAIAGENGQNGHQKASFGDSAFGNLWDEINSAVTRVCDKTTFADLIEFEQQKRQSTVPDYVI